MKPARTSSASIAIGGITYWSGTEVCRTAGISRQTLWRWRSEKRIPAGRRYRDRTVVFTQEELEQIREYANRLEPLDDAPKERLKLVGGSRPKKRANR